MTDRMRQPRLGQTMARRALVLRALAGAPASAAIGRRGSALVLAVSALALIVVIIVGYVAVSRGDRRTGATQVRRDQQHEQIDRILGHVSATVGDDALDVYVNGQEPFTAAPGAGTPVLMREATDYPSVDPARRTTPTTTNPVDYDRQRFSPTGGLAPSWRAGRGIVDFAPSDPFLASTLPTWLNPGPNAPMSDWIDNSRDWDSVSCLAPDGRFVNLYAIRNNFDAEPGLGTDTLGRPRTSQLLTLLMADGQSYMPGSSQLDYSGQPADPNVPAHWATRQVGAFRPATDPLYGFDDARRSSYQWADADGDGMYDSRWIELADATDPDNVKFLLPRDGRYRWFAAVRVVDLSGLANINTATDLLGAPDDTVRVGLTPADVDIRSLLTMGRMADVYGRQGYTDLNSFGAPPGENYNSYGPVQAQSVGALGLTGARVTIDEAQVPPPGTDLSQEPILAAWERAQFYLTAGGFPPGVAGYETSGSGPVFRMTGQFGLSDLAELLTYRSVNDPSVTSRLERAMGGRDAATPSFSALRDNRSLALEMSWSVDTYGQAVGPVLYRSALDLRQFITTLSGARPLRPAVLEFDPGTPADVQRAIDDLSRADGAVRLDAVAALDAAGRDTVVTNRDPSFLFAGYARALAPFLKAQGAWDAAGSPEMRTVSYGGSADLALRTAGHLTANMIDLYDTDKDPSAYTLVVDIQARSSVAPSLRWWNEPNESGRLDLDAALGVLSGPGYPGDPSRTRLANGQAVFSPAVNIYGVEAQPFLTEVAVYSLYTDTPLSKGGDQEWTVVNNGGIGSGGEIVPGLVTINGDIANDNDDYIGEMIAFQVTNPFDVPIDLADDYYIEFAGRYFDLKALDATGTAQPVTINARQTKVFYALSQPRATLQARLANGDASVPADALDRWVDAQVESPTVEALEVAFRDKSPGGPIFRGLLEGQPGDRNRNDRVMLWRALRASGEAVNDPTNDLLADRLRDPGVNQRPTLDRRMDPGQNQVAGTQAGDETGSAPLDNTGYTITYWSTIRRCDDPGDTATNTIPIGALPAWCIERKFGTPMNHGDHDSASPGTPTKSDFTSDPGDTTLSGLVVRQATSSTPLQLVMSIDVEPYLKNGKAIDPVNQSAGRPYGELYAELVLENDRFERDIDSDASTPDTSVLRVGDLLLPMAVGPVQEVGPGDPWMTLGESMALALGYDTPPPSLSGAAHPLTGAYTKLDRGRVRMDGPAPYVDYDRNGRYDPASDELRGSGAPLGAGVLDVFTALADTHGSISRPTMGVVNLNTAPVDVLRTLPMLSPPRDLDATGRPQWFWPAGAQNATSDIAATLWAYREKSRLVPRSVGPTFAVTDLNFVGESGVPGHPADLIGRTDPSNPTAGPTRLESLRESRGFGSLGEVMAVRDRDFAGLASYPAPHDMDRLGADTKSNARPGGGIDSITYDPGIVVGSGRKDDGLRDDHDEQLSIASALVSSAAVRSDYFAAWVVVQGYQRADVEGLTPQDPLTPSVARRYLMIIDRSSVLKKGDRPRVLVVKELPL